MKKKNIYKKSLILKPVIIAAFIIFAGIAALISSSDHDGNEELVVVHETASSQGSSDISTGGSAEHDLTASGTPSAGTEETSFPENDYNKEADSDHSGEYPVVYICGEVVTPGLYRCSSDSRIADVVEQAGGLLPEADDTCVNMAARITDAQQIIITKKGEALVAGSGGTNVISGAGTDVTGAPAQSSGLVNINTADESMLKTLPGIGEQKAKAIISYRQNGGIFTKIEDIMNVSGIKNGAFNKIKELITV